MDKSQEAASMMQEASNGVWFPVAIVGSVLGVLLLVLLAYWKLTQIVNEKRLSDNEKRHEESEKIISELYHNATVQTGINARLETLVQRNVRDIERIKDNK